MENERTDCRVLVVDDDLRVHNQLSEVFQKDNLHMVSAFDGEQATEMLSHTRPDIIVLDVVMPKKDGLQLCREIRAKSDLPIIILSAKGEEADRLLGLQMGADDYLVKPFSAKEIAMRIRTILRRVGKQKPEEDSSILVINNLEINIRAYSVLLDGKQIPCTPKEIDILWMLATNPGVVFSRDHILQNIWGYDYMGDTRAVDSHIKRIRAKLCKDHNKWDIHTVWGVGYRFEKWK